jgi:signal transduction histidine kinase
LKSLINEVYNSFKSEEKILKNQIEFKLNYFVNPEEIKIKTDKGKLKQLLSNLINNAIKFTHKGKVEIRVFNKINEIIIDVIDTGIGIEEQNQNIIFDRFIQVEMNANRPFEGAGIGLTISKAIVDKLNGKISVKSKVGKGSVFRVEIPIKK